MFVWLVSHWGGTNSDNFEGARSVKREFILKNFVIDAFAQSLSDCDGGVVYQYPATGHVFGVAEMRVREGRVSPVYTSDCECVLFTHELVGALLPFSGMVATGEMVAVEALVGSAVG